MSSLIDWLIDWLIETDTACLFILLIYHYSSGEALLGSKLAQVKLKQNTDFDMARTFPPILPSGRKNEPLLPQRFLCPIKYVFIVLSSTFTHLHKFVKEWKVVLRRAERMWHLVFWARLWEQCHLGMSGLNSKVPLLFTHTHTHTIEHTHSEPIPALQKISSVTSLGCKDIVFQVQEENPGKTVTIE